MSRLEEIKSHEKVIYYLLGNERTRRYFDWLIQQAERVEELEKSLNTADVDLHNMFINYKKIKGDRDSYKQALEEMRLHAHYPDIIKDIYEQTLEADKP